MRDDFQSQAWADSHYRLSSAIHTAIHKLARIVGEAMARKNAYDFDAPWRRPAHTDTACPSPRTAKG